MKRLIHKLVEERVSHYVDNPDFYSRHDNDIYDIALVEALRDFGIKEEEWVGDK